VTDITAMNIKDLKLKTFKWDYTFYQRHIQYIALFGFLGHLFFFLILNHWVGYYESAAMRFAAMGMIASLALMPKSGRLNRYQKSYIELTYFIQGPLLFSWHTVFNGTNTYWFCSMIFCGLVHGLLSQTVIGLTGFVLATFIPLIFIKAGALMPYLDAQLTFMAFFVAFIMFLFASLLKIIWISSMEKLMQIEIDRNHILQLEENFRKMEQRNQIIQVFMRPSLLTEIAMGKDPIEYKPRRLKVAMLFADLKNYTSITEKIALEECYEYLNDYFSTINSSIYQHFGEIDKIMGDAVMATFPSAHNCLAACSRLRRNVSESNRARVDLGKPLIKFGTGLSYGEVLSGNFGTREKLDRTIIGDVVNVGARLESLTRIYQVDVIISGEFFSELQNKDDCRLIDSVRVKGKRDKIDIYENYAHQKSIVVDFKNSQKERIATCIALKKEGEYADALRICDELIEKCPVHTLYKDKLMDPYLLVLKNELILNRQQRQFKHVEDKYEQAKIG
jgi:class 3 adenylate cyclase